MKIILALLTIIALSGCSTSGDYKEYVAAQSEANRQATAAQKPLVLITAQPGQAITGLASLAVYMPVVAQTVQQAKPNEWVGLMGQGLSIFGAVAGLKVSGDAAIGLADSVGKYSTQGYANIQAPAANISNVTTTTDASNRSTTTGAVTTTSTVSTSSDSSTHSTPTTSITGSYNPSAVTTTAPAAEVSK